MKKLIAATVLAGSCMLFCLVNILCGAVRLDHAGFAVDHTGLLYIGGGHCIDVYDGNELVKTITEGTERGFAFTIKNGDTLVVSNASHVYEMDLDGNVVDKYPDESSRTFLDLQRNKTFTTEDGTTYCYRSFFGRKQIYCGEQLMYQMPIYDYCVKVLLVVSITSFVCCIGAILYHTHPIFDEFRETKK